MVSCAEYMKCLLPRLVTADGQLAATGFLNYITARNYSTIVFTQSQSPYQYSGHFVMTSTLCYPPVISTFPNHFWSMQVILGSQRVLHNHHMLCWQYLMARGLMTSIQSSQGSMTSLDGLRPFIAI